MHPKYFQNYNNREVNPEPKRINDEFINLKKENYINPEYISNFLKDNNKIDLAPKKIDEMRELYQRCQKIRRIKQSIDINNIYFSILREIEKAVIKGEDSVLIAISDTWDRNTLEEIRMALKRDGFTVTYDFFDTTCLRVYGWV